jgi:hypothetical protein
MHKLMIERIIGIFKAGDAEGSPSQACQAHFFMSPDLDFRSVDLWAVVAQLESSSAGSLQIQAFPGELR